MASAIVGDYILDRKIGSGAFSTVWRARHRLRGTLVAVKEIGLDRLSDKLRHNLMSEVSILRRINHPNIIALYDYIQVSGRIYIVLEYCSGGDLSMYIQNHGQVAEATAKHFMLQLATGLQVLRDNNVIHRDLKPQNLLLSTNDGNAVLKIADFGFARSLQPLGLAETLCGSPLYMAPEVMQFQKYDAKADLWSVGVILYQLVTGRTPFSGNSQLQLLQNIVKTNELNFPRNHNLSRECVDLCQKLLRRSAVQRLTFEEFFNHQFLSEHPEVAVSRVSSSTRSGFPSYGSFERRPSRTSSNEDCLPFPLDDEPIGQDVDESFPIGKSLTRFRNKVESGGYRQDSSRPPESTKEMGFANNGKPTSVSMKDDPVIDSLELVDQEYVIVPGPPLDISSSPVSASSTRNSPYKSESSKLPSPKFSALSAPMPIIGAAVNNTTHPIGSIDSRSSPASGTSNGSTEFCDTVDQPSSNFITRIRFLQLSAAALSDMVKEKVVSGRHLEAFSIQLVVLAIWKQALHVCHAQLASDIEENASTEGQTRKVYADVSNTGDSTSCADSELPDAICSQIEKEFLLGVGHAEELSLDVDRLGATDMPDAIEIIFQSALTLGRDGAVAEMMGKTMRASTQYAKAVCLLDFLLVEAPSLALNPPFSLTNSDRYRLRMYIDVISNRQGQSRFQRMGIKIDDQMMPST